MKKTTSLIVITCLLASAIWAQTPVIKWQKTIGGDAADQLSIILPTPDGGFIAGGSSVSTVSGEKTDAVRCSDPAKCATDYWILKLNDTGAIEWQRTIGCNASDDLKSIGLTADGGYIIGGASGSDICTDKTGALRGGTNNDYWILKLNGTGATQWQKTIGGSRGDRLVSIEQTADGGYIVGGTSQSNISNDKTNNSWVSGAPLSPVASDDYWILKLDDTGRIEWQKTIGGFTVDDLRSIHQTADGGYIVGGSSSSIISGNKTEGIRGNNDYWILKLNTTGDIVWQRTIGGNKHDELSSIRQTPDGGYIVGGSSMSDDLTGERTDIRLGTGEDYWILKLDNAGAIQWQKAIRAEKANKMADIHQTSDGGYIIGGTSTSDISGDKTEDSRNATNDYWVLKLNDTGAIQWQKTIGGDGDDVLSWITEYAPGEYILGGSSGSAISGDKTETSRGGSHDFWIIKLHFECDTAAQYISDSFCRTIPFSHTLPGGDVVNAPGTYRDSFVAYSGCDSIIVTTLSHWGPDTSVQQSAQTLTAEARGVSYQWINCSDHQPVGGATEPSFTAETDGNFAVIITANNCSDTSSCYTVTASNNIHSLAQKHPAYIYPNPASGEIHIASSVAVHTTITAIDGKLMLQLNKTGRADISDIPNGLYIIRMTDENGHILHVGKLIKTKQ